MGWQNGLQIQYSCADDKQNEKLLSGARLVRGPNVAHFWQRSLRRVGRREKRRVARQAPLGAEERSPDEGRSGE